MNAQEALWAGDFGREYLDRNRVKWEDRLPFWKMIVARTMPLKVLEVGCSRGHNLQALRRCKVPIASGIDINPVAVSEAVMAGLKVYRQGVTFCAFMERNYDLVFTAGMLIHVAPENIQHHMRLIAGASAQYVLAIEYDAAEETAVEYRGQTEALWKRPYGQLYESLGLVLREHGDEPEGFPRCHWWLLERPIRWMIGAGPLSPRAIDGSAEP